MRDAGLPVVEVRDLNYVYPNGVEALRGISFTIDDGDVFGIIGQNGCGKTTTVKHFNGLLKPTSGEVVILGESTKDKTVAQLSQNVGMVFQNPDYQLFMTSVEDEINYGPINIGMTDEERSASVEQLIVQLGLADKLDKHPFELTRLERKMVCIAGVLAMKPRVIIFDEPTTGQDVVQMRVIMDLFRDFSSEGHTLVVVSHDMGLIAEYCTHVIVMSQGQILADGPPAEVFANPVPLACSSLTPPQITQMAQALDIKEPILSVQEAVDFTSRARN